MATDRQIVAAAFRGRLAKPARDLSPAYVARLARSVREQRAAGVKRVERNVARGHAYRVAPSGQRVSTEHPTGRVRRGGVLVPWRPDIKPTPIRVSEVDRHVAGHGVLVQREFRARFAAWRWARRLPPGTGVQMVGHGELRPEYGGDEASEADQEASEANADETGEPLVTRSWRAYYTGNSEGMPDENGAAIVDYGDAIAAEERVFIPGTVDAWIVRWQR